MIVDELKKSLFLSSFQGKLSTCFPGDSSVEDCFKKIIIKKGIDSKETKRRKINVSSNDTPYTIPNNWKWVKMGYLCDVVRGLTFSTSYKEKKENTVLVLRGGNIDSKTEKITYDDNIYVDSSIPNSNQYLEVGDTLIVASSGTKTSVGKSAFISDIENNVSFGGFMMVVRPYKEIVNPKYISYHIKMYRNKIINDTNGYISNITNEILNNLLIPLPPLEEQNRIVDKLDELFLKLDEIKPLEEEIDSLRKNFSSEFKQSILFNYVLGLKKNDKIQLAKYNEIELLPNWKWIKLKDVTNLRMGKTILGRDLIDNGIPVYSATISSEPFGYIKEIDYLLHNGDIVIPARGNSIGYATYIDDEIATCTQTTIGCKISSEKVYGKYLYYCCYAFKNIWFKYTGSAIPQITISKIGDNFMPLPPLDEQYRIVEKIEKIIPFCDDIDSIINN